MKRKSGVKLKTSDCPMSEAKFDRCMAGGPEQIHIHNNEIYLGFENMKLKNISKSDVLRRCKHCGVVYVDTGIKGLERIIGDDGPNGFVPKTS
jgi:hypothetical protein